MTKISNLYSLTNFLNVDSSGRIGVGTSNPTANLTLKEDEVNKALVLYGRSSDNLARIDFFRSDETTFAGRIQLDNGTNSNMSIRSQGNLRLQTGGSNDRLTIDSAGAATFSSSVTATTATLSGSASDRLIMTRTGIGTYHLAISGDDRFSIYDPSADAERISITASGSVGIGVTPSAWNTAYKVLQVGSTGTLFNTASNTILGQNIFVNSSDNNAYLTSNFATQYRQVNGQHIWYTAPSGTAGNAISFTQAMTLDASGRLAIGMPSASQRLQVNGRVRVSPDDNNGGDIAVNDGGLAFSTIGATPFQFWINNYSTQVFRIASNADVYMNNNAALFYGASALTYIAGGNTSMTIAVNNGTALSFNSSRAASFTNNVSATGYIYTNGNLATANGNQTANSVSASLFLGNRGFYSSPDVGAAQISAISTGTFWYSGTAMAFYTNPGPDVTGTGNVERMRITSGGRLLVGSTSDGATGLVQISGTARAVQLVASEGGITAGNYAVYGHDDNNGYINVVRQVFTGDFHFRFDGTTRATINRTSGAYTATSDVNKKKDFEESTIGLAEVMQLKPTLFRFKADSDDAKKDLGFIAQEVKDHIPQAYVENAEFIGLNQMPLIAALTKALQELTARLEQLENK